MQCAPERSDTQVKKIAPSDRVMDVKAQDRGVVQDGIDLAGNVLQSTVGKAIDTVKGVIDGARNLIGRVF